jgi:hypothetical protein
MGEVTATITAEDQWTKDDNGQNIKLKGLFNFSRWGDGVGNVTFQRSFDGGITWLDTDVIDSNLDTTGTEPEYEVMHRAGVKTGDYDSGTIYLRLGQ